MSGRQKKDNTGGLKKILRPFLVKSVQKLEAKTFTRCMNWWYRIIIEFEFEFGDQDGDH